MAHKNKIIPVIMDKILAIDEVVKNSELFFNEKSGEFIWVEKEKKGSIIKRLQKMKQRGKG